MSNAPDLTALKPVPCPKCKKGEMVIIESLGPHVGYLYGCTNNACAHRTDGTRLGLHVVRAGMAYHSLAHRRITLSVPFGINDRIETGMNVVVTSLHGTPWPLHGEFAKVEGLLGDRVILSSDALPDSIDTVTIHRSAIKAQIPGTTPID